MIRRIQETETDHWSTAKRDHVGFIKTQHYQSERKKRTRTITSVAHENSCDEIQTNYRNTST
ncbi:hypothetical protein E2C01_080729 [Portunus trituberculatus]|uniref:Uncharacterized protein n=1 Tax=Portunus trituberculatus TaxID=210409 RepID=A0A5B7J0D3_PORTR|nr:hypothetical protein [Portunus trituberculatus]